MAKKTQSAAVTGRAARRVGAQAGGPTVAAEATAATDESAYAATAQAFGFGAAAQAVAAGRPSHIVVFREASERAVSSLQRQVRRLGARSVKLADTVVGLGQPTARGGAEAQVFPELGVATTTLTGEEHQRLLSSNDVETVVPNQLRTVQWYLGHATGAVPSPLAAMAARPGVEGGTIRRPFPFGQIVRPPFPFGVVRRPFPFGGTIGPVFPFALQGQGLIAYLLGQRDAVDAMIAHLSSSPGATPSDQPFRSPTPMRAANGALTWGLQVVGVTGAAGQMTGKDVKVAILDTGLDTTHPDWSSRPVATDPTRGRSFVPNVESIMDGAGHGTHTAGTLAGPVQSVSGTRYGVAPDCDLYVGKVMDDSGHGFDSDILDGIQWALTNQCRVISMSLGSIRNPNEPYSIAYERVAQRLLDRPDGALIVAAAGNESHRSQGQIAPVDNPAACPSVVSVGAIDAQLQVADFSCGQTDDVGIVDFCGPGVAVFSSFPVKMGSFVELDGTSMATPHVAGVAVCLLQGQLQLTPRQLWDLLRSHSFSNSCPATDCGRGIPRL